MRSCLEDLKQTVLTKDKATSLHRCKLYETGHWHTQKQKFRKNTKRTNEFMRSSKSIKVFVVKKEMNIQ